MKRRGQTRGDPALCACADYSGDRVQVATEPAAAGEIKSNDELYLIGLHLEQYRHATRNPEPYWLEAVRRDRGRQPIESCAGSLASETR